MENDDEGAHQSVWPSSYCAVGTIGKISPSVETFQFH